MALFGRKHAPPPPSDDIASPSPQRRFSGNSEYGHVVGLVDSETIHREWIDKLGGRDQGMLAWRNGTRMFFEDHPQAQRFNLAEYMTRALAFHLVGEPLLDDDDAVLTAHRMALLLQNLPLAQPGDWSVDPEIEWVTRLARLPLAVIRDRGWQSDELGGNGRADEMLKEIRLDGVFVAAVRPVGVTNDHALRNFFTGPR